MLDNDDTSNDQHQTDNPQQAQDATDVAQDAPADVTDGATDSGAQAAPAKKTAKRAATKKTAAKRTTTRRTTKKVAAADTPEGSAADTPENDPAQDAPTAADEAPARPRKKAAARKRAAAPAASPEPGTASVAGPSSEPAPGATSDPTLDPTLDPARDQASGEAPAAQVEEASGAPMVLFQAPVKKAPARKRTTRKVAATRVEAPVEAPAEVAVDAPAEAPTEQPVEPTDPTDPAEVTDPAEAAEATGDQTTDESAQPAAEDDSPTRQGGRGRGRGGRSRGGRGGAAAAEAERSEESTAPAEARTDDDADSSTSTRVETSEDTPGDTPGDRDTEDNDSGDDEGGNRRRRRRGGRRRRKPSDSDSTDEDGSEDSDGSGEDSGESPGDDGEDSADGGGSRRRRRRRRSGDSPDDSSDDPENTVTRARKQRKPEDEITSVNGSTRLEAKKQRRREGREAGRRRAPIVSEAEFLARREAVDRVMVIRQADDLTQIGVLEDKVLVEHYVARESQTSMIGNVYLGRVQNVLPSMEAAFIDIGKGRNAVLYAGEVNWAALGHKDGQQRKIESVLSSGQTILVQVTKDPVGHKGARLSGQISLPGRFLVFVPEGNTSGISRKLPDTERNRLKTLLKEIVPDTAGVIVRTAAEGASEEELTLDVERLTARWGDIEEKVKSGKSPQLLYGEPDLTLKVVRDLFTEDFARLVVQGDDAWDLVDGYVSHVAPDLRDRLERFEPAQDGPDAGKDLFATYRVDEQIAKGLDRKVWLPSGGSLIIDRTEAMTVVDVNTGKFTGSGGNLEETVTKNNLESAEEIVRQLRLRDIGGIIVIDFIDMVLESNRDLVLRRLVECLGRDRTRHQVAEVTSLGLVQMTRKRIGTGLLEAFSTDCEHCKGRGIVLHDHPVEQGSNVSGGKIDDDEPRGRRGRGGRNRRATNGNGSGNGNDGGSGNGNGGGNGGGGGSHAPSPADLAATRPPEKQAEDQQAEDQQAEAKQADEAGPLADTAVIGTPSAVSPEPVEVPSEAVAPQETVQEPVQEPAQEPDQQPVAHEPEPPRVVTTTRRRSARRPAGPPAAVGEAAHQPGAGTAAAPSAEPVAVPVSGPVSGPVEPRPEDVTHGDQLADGLAEDEERSDEESASALSLLHVPVKRKGSRKR